jgi:hypothetical protein
MPTHQYIPHWRPLCPRGRGRVQGRRPDQAVRREGTWSLDKFDIGEGITNLDLQEREDQFLLYFDPETEIVAAAACIDSMGNIDITESLCDTGVHLPLLQLHVRRDADDLDRVRARGPPGPAGPARPEDEDGADPSPASRSASQLEAYPESNNTYRYSGLPFGLFSSDGVSSRYVFQVRGESVFVATGCLETCGATSAAPPEM